MLFLQPLVVAFVSNGPNTLRVCLAQVDDNKVLDAPNALADLNTFINQVQSSSNPISKFPDTHIELQAVTAPSVGSLGGNMVKLGQTMFNSSCTAVIGPDASGKTDFDTFDISHFLRQYSIPVCSLGEMGEDSTTRALAKNLISVVPSNNLLVEKIGTVVSKWGSNYQIILDPGMISLVSSITPAITANQIVLSLGTTFNTDVQNIVSTLAASQSNIVLFLGSSDLFAGVYSSIAIKLKKSIQWVWISMTPVVFDPTWAKVYVAFQPRLQDSSRLLCLKSFVAFYEANTTQSPGLNGNYIAANISKVSLPAYNISGTFSASGDLESDWMYASSSGTTNNDIVSALVSQDLRMKRGSSLLQTYPSSYIALLVFAYIFAIFTLLIGVVLRRKIQKKRSGILDLTTITGIIWGNLYVFAAIPSPTMATCSKSMWFLPISLSIVLSTMIVRSYRLYRIFGGAQLHSQKLNDFNLFLLVICMVLVNVIVLVIWTAVDPLVPTVNYQYLQMTCDSTYSSAFTGILLAYNGVLMLVAGFLANSTRKIVSEYTESTQLAWSVYNVALWSLISVVIQFSGGIDPSLKIVFMCTAVLCCVNTFTLLLFGPALIKTRNELNASRSNTSTVSTFQKLNAGANNVTQLTANADTKLFTQMADVCEPGAVNMYRKYLVIVSNEEKYIDLFDLRQGQVNFTGRTFKLDLLDKLKMEDMKNGGVDLVLDQIHLYVLFNGEELNTKFKQLIRPFVQMKQNANMQARL